MRKKVNGVWLSVGVPRDRVCRPAWCGLSVPDGVPADGSLTVTPTGNGGPQLASVLQRRAGDSSVRRAPAAVTQDSETRPCWATMSGLSMAIILPEAGWTSHVGGASGGGRKRRGPAAWGVARWVPPSLSVTGVGPVPTLFPGPIFACLPVRRVQGKHHASRVRGIRG